MSIGENRWRAARLAFVCGTALGLTAATAHADVVLRTVALSGTSAGSGLVYDRFDAVTINGAGSVVFQARLVLPVGANDECAGAIPIPAGGTFISTVGATDSSVPGASCANADVWFSYAVAETGPVTFSVTGMNFVAILGLYSGTCGALQQLACAPAFTYQLNAAETVYLRVGHGQGGPERVQRGTCVVTIRPGLGLPPVLESWTDQAIFAERNGGVELVRREGTPTGFDAALVHTGLEFPAVNEAGTVALLGGIAGAPPELVPLCAAFTESPGGVTVLLEREVPPVPPAGPDWFLPPPQLLASGAGAYARLDGTSLRYGPDTLVAGGPAPGLPGDIQLRFIDQPVASGNAVGFRATLQGNVSPADDAALWADFDGPGGAGQDLVARTNDPAPGTPAGTRFASLAVEPGISPEGRLVFWASLTGGVDASNDAGIWATARGPLSLLARAGDPAPGVLPGVVFQSLGRRPGINASRDIILAAQLTGPGVAGDNNAGIWFYPLSGIPRVVVREGQHAAGLPAGVVYAEFSDPVLNDRGDVEFVARLRGTGVAPASSTALFVVGPDGIANPIVRTGDMLDVAPGDTRTLREIDFGTLPASSGRGQLSHRGPVAFLAYFTDDSTGLFVADRTCAVDLNADGMVDSRDFFVFLQLFFAGDARADVNHSGGVDSQDFFDFLSGFFAGC